MNLLKRIYYGGSSLVPLHLLTRISPVTSLFPYHHIVSDEYVPHIRNMYPYKNVRQFTNDLEFLLKYFQPITPPDLISFINQHNSLPRKKFLITFDDGFKEVYEIVAPILKARSVPAIFFINPAFIDNKEMFYRNKISIILGILKEKQDQPAVLKKIAEILSINSIELPVLKTALLSIKQDNKNKLDEVGGALGISFEDYLKQNRPWLTSGELAKLSADGFCIGAHSWDHPYYQSLTIEGQLKQTLESCNYIRQYSKLTTFSFPHSDTGLSQQLFDQLLNPEHGVDLLFGIQNQKNEISNKMIHRFNCERPGVSIEAQVKGILTYARAQQFLNKQTIRRYA